MRTPFVLSIGTVVVLSGCATYFQDAAPADEGYLYVVGARQIPFAGMQARVWRCPASSSGECEEIKVIDREETRR